MNAAKIVNSAVLGMDFQTAVINGKAYVITPPTIHKLAGAGYYLAEMGNGSSISDLINDMKNMGNVAHALSYLIKGDDSLYEEFINANFTEVIQAFELGFSLISTQDFLKLSILARNVQNLTAKQKP